MTLSRVLRTKLVPPPRNARTLARPRVNQVLRQALEYRLTILQAEAGYGKSTALSELAAELPNAVWFQSTGDDNDPLVFLLQLCHAFRRALPDAPSLPIFFLEAWDGTNGPLPWRRIIDQMINALTEVPEPATLLILDDAHLLTENSEIPLILDRLIGLARGSFHVLLAGRPTISLPSLTRWRAQGETLILDQSTLTFTKDEISSLFDTHYGLDLTSEELDSLLEYTEGWAIGLQLVWQSIRSLSPLTLEFPFRWQADSLETLFQMLTDEVFERQPADVREFLLVTATLRDLHPEVCSMLLESSGHPVSDSPAMLAYLKRQDLFVIETAEGFLRYHHIFHNFLRQQSPSQQPSYHGEIRHIQSAEELKFTDWKEAVEFMSRFVPEEVLNGRSNSQ